MTENKDTTLQKGTLRTLPRNVWAVSLTSFFMDISSEMVVPILPLFLSSQGIPKSAIGLIEAVAEATASLLKVFAGWLSDKLRARKWLAVAGYALSTVAAVAGISAVAFAAAHWYYGWAQMALKLLSGSVLVSVALSAGWMAAAAVHLLLNLLLATAMKKAECMGIRMEHIYRDAPGGAYVQIRYDNPARKIKERKLTCLPTSCLCWTTTWSSTSPRTRSLPARRAIWNMCSRTSPNELTSTSVPKRASRSRCCAGRVRRSTTGRAWTRRAYGKSWGSQR